MKREIRIIFSIIVLLVGLIGAAMFKPAPLSEEQDARNAREVVVRKVPSHGETISYRAYRPDGSTLGGVELPGVIVPALPTVENVLPVPEESRRVERAQTPEARTARKDVVPDLPKNFPGAKQPLPATLAKRVHTVVDGDTLESLAFRYLDSESRWDEIYQANQAALEDPRALPIGLKLTIPPRTPNPKSRHASNPVVHEVARPIEQSRQVPDPK